VRQISTTYPSAVFVVTVPLVGRVLWLLPDVIGTVLTPSDFVVSPTTANLTHGIIGGFVVEEGTELGSFVTGCRVDVDLEVAVCICSAEVVCASAELALEGLFTCFAVA